MADPTPPVQIHSGMLRGYYDKQGEIALFRGIPFAAPPLGDLRWRPPQPVSPWSGTLQATKRSPRAIQLAADFEGFVNQLVEGQGWGWLKTAAAKAVLKLAPRPKESEDCLYLDVRTPSLDKAARLPVMVWIHGGDYQDGSGSDILYDSNALAQRGAVVVYINYRLGLMGYFAHPELSQESDHGVSGNYGTLDQIAALRWVQENISAFGGDPDNVTIFGESAGGDSVATLLTSPLARGLFRKAILQSPASSGEMMFLRRPFLYDPAGEALGQRFAEQFVPPGPDQVAALRQIPAQQLYQVLRREEAFQHFFPVIDGYVLPESPFAAFAHGEQARVPLLLGSNADEGTLFFPRHRTPIPGREGVLRQEVADLIQDAYGADAAALMALYPGLREGTAGAQTDLLGDSIFGAMVHFYALQAAQREQPVYFYHFTRTPPSSRQTAGAYHAAELVFVHGRPLPLFDFNEADKELAQVVGDYWVAFARDGDPNGAGRPQWPPFTVDEQCEMQLGTGAELGAREVARLRKYELSQRRLRQWIAQMEAAPPS